MRVIKPKRRSLAHVREQIAVYHTEDAVINAALEILRNRIARLSNALNSPDLVRDYLRLNLATLEHETFWCIWLDAQNRVIASEEIFRGTLTQTSVYPREIVKHALRHNAAHVILAHNHPSGLAAPSRADEYITRSLKDSLAIVDVTVLDHFIVGATEVMSFAEKGLL